MIDNHLVYPDELCVFDLVYLEIHFLQALCQHHFTHLGLGNAKSLQFRQPHGCGYPLFQIFQLPLVQPFNLRLFY